MVLVWTLVATAVLPFAIGFWIGNRVFAAAPFLALGITLLVRQATVDEYSPPGLLLGMVAATLISAAAAYAGGSLREQRRDSRAP
jgi:hypothetical protein